MNNLRDIFKDTFKCELLFTYDSYILHINALLNLRNMTFLLKFTKTDIYF
jgi:hypothetical protein